MSNIITIQKINLDYHRNAYISVTANQYDTGQILYIGVFDNGQSVNISDVTQVKSRIKTPDLRYLLLSNENGYVSIQDNKVIVKLPQAVFLAAGKAIGEIVLYRGETQLSTMNFNIQIAEGAYDENEILSDPEQLSVLDEWVRKVIGYANNAKQSADNAKVSEDNALSYKNSASNSANAASTSEANALSYSNSAKTSEDNAKSYEDNALAYKDAAKVSEDNAKLSEDNALASKNSASASEANALTYKNEADTYASNAKASENLSKQYSDNATSKATDASNSANSAKNSELNALSYKNSAKESMDNALDYSNESKEYSESALSSKNDSKYYADLSQSYTNGTGDAEREEAASDNARAYANAAKASALEAAEKLLNQDKILDEVNKKLKLSSFDIDDDGNLIYTDNSSYLFTVSEDGYLNYEVV